MKIRDIPLDTKAELKAQKIRLKFAELLEKLHDK